MQRKGLLMYRAGVLGVGGIALHCNVLLAMGHGCHGALRLSLWLSTGGQFMILLMCLWAKRGLIRDVDDDGIEMWNYLCILGMIMAWVFSPYGVAFVKAFLALAVIMWLVLCHLTWQKGARIALHLGLLCLLGDCFLALILINKDPGDTKMLAAACYIPYSLALTLFFSVHDWRQWACEYTSV